MMWMTTVGVLLCSLVTRVQAPAAQERGEAGQVIPEELVSLEFYDVRDLFGLGEEADKLAAESMVATIRKNVKPEFQEDTMELRFQSGALIARLNQPQHRWLHAFLVTQRLRPEQVLIESYLVTVSKDDFARLGLPGDNVLLQTAAEVQGLLTRLREDLKADLMASPSVLVTPRQEATLSILTTISCVTDWRAERVEPGNRIVADPVIKQFQEGMEVNYWLCPVGLHNYSVKMGFEQSEIQRPIETHTGLIEDLGEVTFAMPRLRSTTVASEMVVPDGGGAIFTCASLKGDTVQGVLFVVRSLSLEEILNLDQDKELGELRKSERRSKDG